MRFQHPGKTGDSIQLVLGTNTGLLDAGLLGNIQIQLYQGGAPVGSPMTLDNALLNLKLLNGVNKTFATITATHDYDGVLVSVGGVLTALTTLNLYGASQLIPLPTLPEDTVSICPGSQATLTATAAAGTSVVWYDGSGTQVGTGASYQTPVLNDTTTYYVGALRDGCPSPEREAITVLVGSPAAPSLVTDSVQVCLNGTATLTVSNPEAGATYSWYATATGGTALSTGTSYTMANVLSDTAYYVGIENAGGCVSVTHTRGVIVATSTISAPELVAGTIETTTGQTVTFQIANADEANFVYHWYTTATGGTSVHDGTSFTTPVVTTAGKTIYYVEAQSKSGCVSGSRTLAVVIATGPTTPLCNEANAQQSPITTGICVLCSVTDPVNAIDGNPATASEIRANVSLLGTIGQLVTFQHAGKAGDTLDLILGTNSGLLDAGVLSGVFVQFYAGGAPIGSATKLSESLLHVVLLQGTATTEVKLVAPTDYDGVKVGMNGLVTALSSLYLYNASQLIPLPTLTEDTVSICPGSQATLTATAAAGTSVVWYDGSGTQVGTGASYQTPVLNDTTTYYVGALRDGCPSPEREAITVLVGSPAAPSLVTDSVQVCLNGTATLTVSNPEAGATYSWYATATGGTALSTGTSYTMANVLSDTAYYVGIENAGGCVSVTRTRGVIVATSTISAPELVAGTIETTTGQTVTFQIANADEANFVYHWYTTATGGTSVHDGTSFTTPVVTTAGKTIYYVEAQSKSGCVSGSRTLAVVIATGPTTPLCNEANAQQSPITTGICVLCSVTDPVNAIDGNPATASEIRANVSLLGTIGQLVTFQHAGKAGDSIQLVLGTNAGLLDAGVLSGVFVQFYAGGAPIGSATKLSESLLHVVLLQGTATTEVKLVVPTDYDGVKVGLNGAVTALSSLYLYNASQLIPLPTLPEDTVSICPGSQATLTATAAAGTSVVWYDGSGTQVGTGASYQTPVLNDTTTYYVGALRDGCPSPEREAITVLVGSPAAPSLVTDSVQVCLNGTATLTVSNPEAGATYSWYATATGGTALSTGTSYTMANVLSDTAYYVGIENAGGCVSVTRTRGVIVATSTISAPELVAGTIETTTGQTVTFQIANADEANFVYHWYTTATGGTSVHDGTSFTTPVVTTAGKTIYYVEAQSKSGLRERIPDAGGRDRHRTDDPTL